VLSLTFKRLACNVFIVLLAFSLRVYNLDSQSLRGDEAATVHYSALPITELWELARVTDPHPPLYYLMLHPWQVWVGKGAWGMRFAGVVASVLSVAALYTLTRRTLPRLKAGFFSSTIIGLLAAGLLAVNPFQIWLAQDIRSYPFFMLFGLLSSWALWVGVSRVTYPVTRPTLNWQYLTPWGCYVIFTVVSLYMHYYTAFLIAFQGVFVLVNGKFFWPHKWRWLASQVTIGVLILPGLYLASNFLGQAAGGIEIIPLTEILHLASTALLTGFTLDPGRSLWVTLLLAPLWLVGLVALLRRNLTAGMFWALFFIVPVGGVIALSIDRPFFKERFLVQAHPAFELLLAVGLWQIANYKSQITNYNTQYALRFTFYALRFTAFLLLTALLYFNFVALSNYFTDPVYAKAPPWRLYHDYVKKNARPGDLMLTNFPEASISYYSPDGLPFNTIPVERDRSTAFRLKETEKTANAYQRVWFLPLLQQGFDEQGDVLTWLDRHADRVNQIFFPGYNVNLYVTPPTIEANLAAQPVTFAHGINLRGYQIFDKKGVARLSGAAKPVLTLKPGDNLPLSLYWQANGPTPLPYTVFTHLVAADGFVQASQDNQPVWGSYPPTAWSPGEKITDKYMLTLPAGLAASDYRLRIGWYQSDTQARVAVIDKGEPVGDEVTLAVIIRVD
jgi:uncharacterized membrane protein